MKMNKILFQFKTRNSKKIQTPTKSVFFFLIYPRQRTLVWHNLKNIDNPYVLEHLE